MNHHRRCHDGAECRLPLAAVCGAPADCRAAAMAAADYRSPNGAASLAARNIVRHLPAGGAA